MMNGNGSTPPEASLEAELARAKQLIQLFRQQRDQAASMCNDLQVELALLRQELEAAQSAGQPVAEGFDVEQQASESQP